MAGSINSVVIVGNLTRDPELRATPSGTSVCSLRVAVNDRVKDPISGEWGDKPNYFDVDVFGGQGERCAQYLARGRQVAVSGRLRWREWEAQDGQKRQAVSIVADNVQFIGPRDGGGSQQAGGYQPGGGSQQAGQRQGGPDFKRDGLTPPADDFGEDADDIPF
ncbi:MAG: single-stranded DNA-binding protein [Actinobacteria bacterium]|nr:single-stranded DNA-binding protein [Actinomycetota bacterium]